MTRPGTKQLILNADDLGYDPAVTRGILESMRAGVVSSATLMVNTPFSAEAARNAQGLALGLHLNLARHPPLSALFPRELLERGELVEARADEISAQVVFDETMAQLEKLQALLGEPATHIDVHKHLHTHPQILEGVLRAAREHGAPVRALHASMRQAIRAAGVATSDHFIGGAGAQAYWTASQLETELSQLQDGVTELMCHPGYLPSHTKSGYAAQREVELRTFTSPQARGQLIRHGVTVVNFRSLRAKPSPPTQKRP